MYPGNLDRDAILDDPVTFARQILSESPHQAQIKAMKGIRQRFHVAIACGRKWGKSLMLAWYLCWYMTTRSDKKVFVVAPTMQQARIIFEKVVYYYTTNPLLKQMLAKKPVFTPFPRLELTNGTVFQARGAANDIYLRGEEAHLVVCDEAAFVRDSTISDVIEPMFVVTARESDSQLILISTPAGHNVFYDWFQFGQGGESGYASFQFPTSSNPYHDKRFLESQKERCGEGSLKWRAEYLAEFIENSLAVFSFDDIRVAYEKYGDEIKEPWVIAPIEGHRYAQGVDIADAGKDFTVCAVFDYTDPENLILVKLERFHRVGWATTYARIRNNHETYNKARTLIDTTGLGAPVLEELRDIHAEGYKISTNELKHELVSRAVRAFAKRIITLSPNPDVISEFKYFQASVTKSGVVRMEASKGHDDIVIAICLGLFNIVSFSVPGFFRAVNMERNNESNPKSRLKNARARAEALWN